jgi:hypothetical protein
MTVPHHDTCYITNTADKELLNDPKAPLKVKRTPVSSMGVLEQPTTFTEPL